MPIATATRTARLISVHDEPNSFRLELPSITPGIYRIPGINAPDSEFETCIFSFPKSKPVQYATRHELNGHKYIEIEVFEGRTPQYGTELNQPLDEYGFPMNPPLQRALLLVTPEDIANELERQCVFFDQNMGVRAITGEVTPEVIAEAEFQNLKYMQRNVAETNRWAKFGTRNVTEQARAHAWRLHKMGKLNPLPDWATVNPEGGMALDTFNCINCGVVLVKGIIKCPQPGCGVIYDWKRAVDEGLIIPRDVPPSRKLEAGLEAATPSAKSKMIEEVRNKVAEDFKENRI
jgi:hypothetical protein